MGRRARGEGTGCGVHLLITVVPSRANLRRLVMIPQRACIREIGAHDRQCAGLARGDVGKIGAATAGVDIRNHRLARQRNSVVEGVIGRQPRVADVKRIAARGPRTASRNDVAFTERHRHQGVADDGEGAIMVRRNCRVTPTHQGIETRTSNRNHRTGTAPRRRRPTRDGQGIGIEEGEERG